MHVKLLASQYFQWRWHDGSRCKIWFRLRRVRVRYEVDELNKCIHEFIDASNVSRTWVNTGFRSFAIWCLYNVYYHNNKLKTLWLLISHETCILNIARIDRVCRKSVPIIKNSITEHIFSAVKSKSSLEQFLVMSCSTIFIQFKP